MSDYRLAIARELLALEEDLLYTEKAHFAAAEELQRVHLLLGLTATLSAAVSVASVVTEAGPLWSGIPALVASLASAVLTFVKPDEKAAQHLGAGRSLGQIRVRSRQHRELGLQEQATPPNPKRWRGYVDEIGKAKAETDQSAPATSNRHFRKAQAKIQAGHFVHDSAAAL